MTWRVYVNSEPYQDYPTRGEAETLAFELRRAGENATYQEIIPGTWSDTVVGEMHSLNKNMTETHNTDLAKKICPYLEAKIRDEENETTEYRKLISDIQNAGLSLEFKYTPPSFINEKQSDYGKDLLESQGYEVANLQRIYLRICKG